MSEPTVLIQGIALGESPRWHEGRLWFADWAAQQIIAIDPDGSLANRRVWAHVEGSAPDGICLDADGTAWYADVPNRCCVRVREGGEVLQRISLDRGGFACMLGGTDGRSLFILAADWRGPSSLAEGERTGQLLVTRVSAPHAGWP